MDTKERLSLVTRSLHWLIAISIICLIAVGLYMSETEAWALYPIHKSVGVLVFGLVLVRVIWRIKNGWPTPVRDYPAWEHKLAVIVHWILIVGTVAMPVSGMIFSGAGGHGIDVFGLNLFPAQHDPLDPTKALAYSEFWSDAGHETHEWLGNIMVIAIGLHIAGALKHHILDKDRTLLRMLGK